MLRQFDLTCENHWQIISRVTKKKFVTHHNECIVLFLTSFFMSWTHDSAKKNRLLISPLSPRMVFSDLALWRNHSWSVTSCKHKVPGLWRHIRRLFLHVQINTKTILWIATVNIDFSPPSVHRLVCKKKCYHVNKGNMESLMTTEIRKKINMLHSVLCLLMAWYI